MKAKSNKKEFLRKLDLALQHGIEDAGQIYQNAMRRSLRGGFKSGDFVTGNLQNSVTQSPIQKEGGKWVIYVGTNVPYAVFWEVGHMNIYTRRFEREERWRPTMIDSMPKMRKAIDLAIRNIK